MSFLGVIAEAAADRLLIYTLLYANYIFAHVDVFCLGPGAISYISHNSLFKLLPFMFHL